MLIRERTSRRRDGPVVCRCRCRCCHRSSACDGGIRSEFCRQAAVVRHNPCILKSQGDVTSIHCLTATTSPAMAHCCTSMTPRARWHAACHNDLLCTQLHNSNLRLAPGMLTAPFQSLPCHILASLRGACNHVLSSCRPCRSWERRTAGQCNVNGRSLAPLAVCSSLSRAPDTVT